MNKEQLFKQIDEIYSEWHGGELHIGTERTERIKEVLNQAINFIPCCTELPTEKEKESKKLELLKWIETDVNTEVNRIDWRSGFEYCYRWINGDLRK